MQTPVRPFQLVVTRTLQNATPSRLRLLLALITLSAFLFCLVAVTTIHQHAHAIDTVGTYAAPSIFAAEQIKIGFDTMDAALADELLYSPQQAESQEMEDEFEKSRLEVCRRLVDAARNITYGKAEELPIQYIQAGFGQFLMEAEEARLKHQIGKNNEALLAYRKVLKTLQETLRTNADALVKANVDELEEAYAKEKSAAGLSSGFVLVLGLILLAVLLYTQIYLRVRFRRRLSVPLLVATITTCFFLSHLSSALGNCSRDTKVAKEDAYDSIVALLAARSNVYDANAAESRWLLDHEYAPVHEKYFKDKTDAVAHFSSDHNFDETIAAARRHQQSHRERLNLPGFEGQLALELGNIRFSGEEEAAIESLEAFRDYYRADAKIRKLENSGDHAGALKLGLGYDPYGSNYLFSKFDDALCRTLKINQDQLAASVKAAKEDLSNLMLASLSIVVLVSFCGFLGLLPRMEEYMH
jgi:hypothetical protein